MPVEDKGFPCGFQNRVGLKECPLKGSFEFRIAENDKGVVGIYERLISQKEPEEFLRKSIFVFSGGVPEQFKEVYDISVEDIEIMEEFVRKYDQFFLLGEVIDGVLFIHGMWN